MRCLWRLFIWCFSWIYIKWIMIRILGNPKHDGRNNNRYVPEWVCCSAVVCCALDVGGAGAGIGWFDWNDSFFSGSGRGLACVALCDGCCAGGAGGAGGAGDVCCAWFSAVRVTGTLLPSKNIGTFRTCPSSGRRMVEHWFELTVIKGSHSEWHSIIDLNILCCGFGCGCGGACCCGWP